MDDGKVERQINNMVGFILKEAEEQAESISFKANEEFNLQKQRRVQAQKLKIAEEFERKEKAVLVKKKIAESNEINRLRLSVLKEREQGLKTIFEETRQKLAELSQTESYPDQLRLLILQGCMKMKESEVVLQCREADKDIVEAVLESVAAEYEEKRGQSLSLSVYTEKYLPANSAGGVVLSALGGRIRCNNTFEARLRYAYESSLPTIRKLLFAEE
eukprot:TRINITY_DN2858_c0_g1_i1.p1 TRINITY_DN2858_c0_g1~~TRINITY_DN2858_c0_g1_i1.p1  ORF type:complete len:226 (+),score=71.83 TRINITY_DN2858_c0_g1_i1:30-680(+)